ncbi:TolB family protein [Pseudoalteromonas piratica]|uniref:Uncharacterized protein n=1 Tax=Pseudoalteromonas piratica TaxID=1348114 RepID=A0A0A7ECH1_9GAMM|nr:PD40 domain-containing protein [Pseudoalteromonas piratica]AIY64193.1 hypothetical protein OM33_02765 [Pseudoalteromonas piratica]
MKKSLLSLMVAASFATAANDNWQTIETENFKVHFPKAYQSWATSAANELEIVREKVKEQQNRVLDKQVDVIVFDPYNQSNGFAIPSSVDPMMAFFATPPQSDTVISNSSGWQQLLVLHEYVHLVHLAQPTRSEWRQKLRNFSSLYDLTHNPTPRWAAEGYATLLESQMTGRGRLHDNYVESLIMQFAKEGNLPSYSQLSEEDGGYMAGSMAYLVGVRYLQWLEENYSKEQLDAVWTRMQAVKKRDFESAFEGVFLEKPSKLYRRFVAEYTHKALSKEATQSPLDTKEWFDLDYIQTAPSISPDEDKLAIVSKDKKGNTKLTIYATEENADAIDEFEEAQKELLEDDAKDIANSRPTSFKKESKKTLNSINRKGILNPLWQDNTTLIYGAFSTANNEMNTLHQDLFSWNSDTGETKQLTELANVRRFSLADTNIAYAERVKQGYSQLVKIDLTTGQISDLTAPSIDTVYDFPQFKNGKLAYLKTELNQNWSLWVKDLATGKDINVPMPKGYQFLSYPKWSPEGNSIYFVAGVNGETNIYRYTFSSDTLEQLSAGQQVMQYPMPTKQHGLLYLAVNSEGPDIYQLGENATVTQVSERAKTLHATTEKAEQYILPPAKIYQQEVGAQRDYSATDQTLSFALSEQYNSASTALLHVGVKGKDLLNKLSWQFGGALDNKNALNGAYFDAKYQYNKWQFLAHAFDYKINAQNQYQHPDVLAVKEDTTGAYLQASYPYRNGAFKVNSHLAYSYKDTGDAYNQWFALGAEQVWQRDWQSFAIGQSASARIYSGDATSGSWQGFDASLKVFGKAWSIPLYVDYHTQQRDDTMLNIGGFASSLIKPEAQADRSLINELPFYTALSDDYQRFGAGIAFKQNMPWLYVAQHDLDNQDFATSYGVKFNSKFDFAVAPSLLNDLNIDFGIAKIEGDTIQDEVRGWLGLWYSL